MMDTALFNLERTKRRYLANVEAKLICDHKNSCRFRKAARYTRKGNIEELDLKRFLARHRHAVYSEGPLPLELVPIFSCLYGS